MIAQTTYPFKHLYLWVSFVLFSLPFYGQNLLLNSGWYFKLDKSTESAWQTVNIPHTWNAEDAFDDERGYFRGKATYKKQIFFSQTAKDKIHYLKFKGVNQDTKVFVNGKEIGQHKGGYTAFTFNITAFLNYNAYNIIEVKVDNSHNLDIPPLDADFTFWGGIYRDVQLISKPKQHLSLSDFASEGFYINYPNVSEEKASFEVSVLMDNFSENRVKNKLKINFSDAEGHLIAIERKNVSLKNNSSKELVVKFPEVKNPILWSPENPYLYQIEIQLLDNDNKVLETKQQHIGFRWVSVDAKNGLYLNGKPYKMIGVNRHQDYKGFGNAVPLNLQKKDIHLIKEMGANVIRFAHYPHAQELYHLCDELGILVWTEIPIVNKVTNSEAFFDTSLKMQEEHIKQYYNHPSVVMFGYMNEILLRMQFDRDVPEAEKEELKTHTYDLASQLEDLTREKAPNRITVMALHGSELYNETKIADLAMLVGWNLYFGWYTGEINDLGKFLDDQHQRYPERAIMISEYGPGADVRISAKAPIKYDYSQEYQLKLHKSYYEQVQARDFVAGMTAWNFADFGSEFRGETLPHINQKGLVQYDRQPKEIYYWYQSVLQKKTPTIHIADYQKDLTLLGSESYQLTVFSNQNTGKLYLNGDFFTDLVFENGLTRVELTFVEGVNTIRAETKSTADELTINVNRINKLKDEQFKTIAINTGTHINFTEKETGINYLADRTYSEGLYGYVQNSGKCYKKLIPNNIKTSNLEAVYQTILMDCSTYKVDIPDGDYKVTLYFVEPQIKSKEHLIFNLTNETETLIDLKQRIFDIKLNDESIVNHFNMATEYPDKFGIENSAYIKINNNEGLTISLEPLKGEPVISGILIESLNQ